MYLAENKHLRLLTLCGFYVAQGIPWGFVTVALKAWLAGDEFDFSEDQLGNLIAYAVAPWSFKWLWGFAVDSYQTSPMGKRRPWLIAAQIAMLVALGSFVLIADFEASFDVLLGLILIANIFVGLQDVSVDAMAVDLLTDEDRERVSGLMYGANYLGAAIGGAGLGWVIGRFGIQTAILTQCVLLAISLLLPILIREQRGDRLFAVRRKLDDEENRQKSGNGMVALGRDLWRAFSLRSTLIGAIVAITVKLGYGMVSPKFTLYLRNAAGWSLEKYTEVEGFWASLFAFLACCVGAFAAQYFGPKRVTAVGLIALSLMWILVGSYPGLLSSDLAAGSVIVLQEVFLSLVSVGLFAIYCAIAWPRVAAIQFTAYMAIMNFSHSLGSKLAGVVGQRFDLGQLFVVAAVLQSTLVLGVFLIDLRETRRVLGDAGASDSSQPEA